MKEHLRQGSVLCYTKEMKRQDVVQKAINLEICLVANDPQKCYTAVGQDREAGKKEDIAVCRKWKR